MKIFLEAVTSFCDTAPQFFSSFSNKGQLRQAVTQPLRLPTPLCHILKALDVLFHMEPPNI